MELQGQTRYKVRPYELEDAAIVELNGGPVERIDNPSPEFIDWLENMDMPFDPDAEPLMAYVGFLEWFHSKAALDSTFDGWSEQAVAMSTGE